METIKCISAHPIDLDDGRQLGPGDSAENVSLHNAHNKALLDDGHIAVVGGSEEESEPAAVNVSSDERPAKPQSQGGSK